MNEVTRIFGTNALRGELGFAALVFVGLLIALGVIGLMWWLKNNQ